MEHLRTDSLRSTVLDRAEQTYAARLERPWVNFPDYVTLRHPVNDKWFGIVMDVSPRVIGLDSEVEKVDILNVKVDPFMISGLVQEEGFFKAYHMNKQHWVTMLLDGTVELSRIEALLDMSFESVTPKSTASSPAVRKCMQGNKGADTKPELLVRRMLREMGYTGYRLQWKQCPGKPDVAFPGRKIAIFINGCFWHRHEGCKHASQPKTNPQYWEKKFAANVARDKRNFEAAVEQGWKVLVIWECELKKDRLDETRDRLYSFVSLDEEQS